MRLSADFTLSEFDGQSATGHIVTSLQYGVSTVLQPIRDEAGRLRVSSGYRQGDGSSQHHRGEAADLVPLDVGQLELWAIIRNLALTGRIPIDQAIVYEEWPGKGHTHVSWTQRRSPRCEFRAWPAPPRSHLFTSRYPLWHDYHGPLKPGLPGPAETPPASTLPLADEGAPMTTNLPTMIRVPKRAADRLLDDAKETGAAAIRRLLQEVANGDLDLDDANEVADDVIGSLIDAGGRFADVIIEPNHPTAEAASDQVIDFVVDALKGLVGPFLGRAIEAVDDAVGYDPRRATRRLLGLLEEDLTDGQVGDDRPVRVYRLARRITENSLPLAKQLALSWQGKQLYVDGVAWGQPPRRFRAPKAV